MPEASRWVRFYDRWSVTNSVLAFVVSMSYLTVLSPPLSIVPVALYASASLVVLAVGGRRILGAFRPADAITAVRSILAFGLLVWLLVEGTRARITGETQLWLITVVLIAAELSDLLDGFIARRDGPSDFGAVWDMENDVTFSFVLCFLAYGWAGIGGWIVISALIRHGYYLVFRFQSDPPTCPSIYVRFAKSACAFQMIALILTFPPILPHSFKAAVNVVSIGLLLVSFSWDLLLRRHQPA